MPKDTYLIAPIPPLNEWIHKQPYRMQWEYPPCLFGTIKPFRPLGEMSKWRNRKLLAPQKIDMHYSTLGLWRVQ